MADIAINPATPTSGSGATVTVAHATCNPFKITVVFLGSPPVVVATQDNNSNPPPAVMPFVPQTPGTYRVEVECNGTVTDRKTFTVT